MTLESSWKDFAAWLSTSSPKSHAALHPGIDREALEAAVAEPVPNALASLYACAAGQRSGEGVGGVFDGYWFMELEGVDGLVQARKQWAMAYGAGAEWALPARFPFAKDFAGNYLCVQGDRVVEVLDGESKRLATTVERFLIATTKRCKRAHQTMDVPIEVRETHEVYFDATRERVIGDAVTHSVFESLGLVAEVEALESVFGAFDKKPETLFGLAVRIRTTKDKRKLDLQNHAVLDPYDNKLAVAQVGHYSGGGKAGLVLYAWSSRPLPARSRLRVEVVDIELRS